MRIAPVAPPLPDEAALLAEAAAEGYSIVARLLAAWSDGSERYAGPGERLLGASAADGALLGLGGLMRDPYRDDPRRARLRHLYVRPAARRRGVGAALVRALLDGADARFDAVALRVGADPAAAPFYESLRFRAAEGDRSATHHLRLR